MAEYVAVCRTLRAFHWKPTGLGVSVLGECVMDFGLPGHRWGSQSAAARTHTPADRETNANIRSGRGQAAPIFAQARLAPPMIALPMAGVWRVVGSVSAAVAGMEVAHAVASRWAACVAVGVAEWSEALSAVMGAAATPANA